MKIRLPITELMLKYIRMAVNHHTIEESIEILRRKVII